MPTFNRSAFLDEALTALRRQDRPLSQIIVWDDGSVDDTGTVACRHAAESDVPILYQRAENGGKSRALNRSLELATGDYIWICDDDDVSLPGAARLMADALDRTGAGMAAGRHLRFSDDPASGARVLGDTGYWPDLSRGSVLRHLLEDIFFFQNATLVRRGLYDQVGPFREDLKRSIDYEMLVRLAARAPVAMLDDVLFHQRKHDGARGPAGAQHGVAQSEQVWLENDRAIFAGFRNMLPLTLYGAFFSGGSEALRHRAALLQRACVYARRCDWDAAIADLAAAAHIEAGPLDPVELGILRRAMSGKHGAADAFRGPVRRQILTDLARTGPYGRQIARGLARGAKWRLRAALQRRDLGEALRVARFALHGSGRPDAAAGPGLTENRTLPQEAYQW
ncbi:MAG: glycosyltransferase [Marinibacterium sp.]|nr:glycosyltransferase [Marinibacterium sp.]